MLGSVRCDKGAASLAAAGCSAPVGARNGALWDQAAARINLKVATSRYLPIDLDGPARFGQQCAKSKNLIVKYNRGS